jgi:hypothetical protein
MCLALSQPSGLERPQLPAKCKKSQRYVEKPHVRHAALAGGNLPPKRQPERAMLRVKNPAGGKIKNGNFLAGKAKETLQ